jgi:hypothetical protein
VACTLALACAAACSAFRGEDSGASANGDANASSAADGASGLDGGSIPNVDATVVDASAYVSEVMKDGPLVYYRFEETGGATAVATAGAPAGMIAGAPQLAQAGKVGFAYGFDGVTPAYVDVTGDAFEFNGTAPFTLEAWIYCRAIDGEYRHIFIKDTNDQGGARQEYGVWVHLDNNTDPQLAFERYVNGQGNKAVHRNFQTLLSQWHHIAAVYEGQNLLLYIDGAKAEESPDNRSIGKKDKDLLIGTRDPGGQTFDGEIDEIAVYGKALAANRVAAHYQVGMGY